MHCRSLSPRPTRATLLGCLAWVRRSEIWGPDYWGVFQIARSCRAKPPPGAPRAEATARIEGRPANGSPSGARASWRVLAEKRRSAARAETYRGRANRLVDDRLKRGEDLHDEQIFRFILNAGDRAGRHGQVFFGDPKLIINPSKVIGPICVALDFPLHLRGVTRLIVHRSMPTVERGCQAPLATAIADQLAGTSWYREQRRTAEGAVYPRNSGACGNSWAAGGAPGLFYNSRNFLLASMGAHSLVLQTKSLECRVCYRTPGEVVELGGGAVNARAALSRRERPTRRRRAGEGVRHLRRSCPHRCALLRARNPSPGRLRRLDLSLRERWCAP